MQGDLLPFKEKEKLRDSKEGEKEPKQPAKRKCIAYIMGNTAGSFQESQRHSKKRKHHELPSPERSCKHWLDQRNQCFILPVVAHILLPHQRPECHPTHQSRSDSWEVWEGLESGQMRR